MKTECYNKTIKLMLFGVALAIPTSIVLLTLNMINNTIATIVAISVATIIATVVDDNHKINVGVKFNSVNIVVIIMTLMLFINNVISYEMALFIQIMPIVAEFAAFDTSKMKSVIASKCDVEIKILDLELGLGFSKITRDYRYIISMLCVIIFITVAKPIAVITVLSFAIIGMNAYSIKANTI